MKRREFLKVSLAGTLTGAGVAGISGLLAADRQLSKIGVQLYTVRGLMQEDFLGTLREVAAVGYKEFEFAGYYDRSPGEIRSILDDLGVEAPSTHVSLVAVREDLDGLIEQARTIGHRYLTVPSLPGGERDTLQAYSRIAKEFNQIARTCRDAGLNFAYHNHAFEFEAMDGRLPYDVLLEETDPELVEMEVDLFWMIAGGHDPLAYFEKYPGRFSLCHVKDRTASGEMASVGGGVVDFAAIFAKSDQAGLKHYIVEHDRPESPLDSIRASYAHLKELRF